MFSVAETARLQNDDLSIVGAGADAAAADLALGNPASARARDLLARWDFVLDKDSVEAGVYEMFQRRLLANAREAIVPEAIRKDRRREFRLDAKVIDSLHAPDGRFGADPVAGRNALVAKSMDQAVAELIKRFGDDMSAWKYGQEKYHHALIRHPLSDAVNAATLAKLNVGPLPRGGDGNTVSATGGADNQASGGSLKIIADTEDWDNSVGLNTPGSPAIPTIRTIGICSRCGREANISRSPIRERRSNRSARAAALAPPGTATQRTVSAAFRAQPRLLARRSVSV